MYTIILTEFNKSTADQIISLLAIATRLGGSGTLPIRKSQCRTVESTVRSFINRTVLRLIKSIKMLSDTYCLSLRMQTIQTKRRILFSEICLEDNIEYSIL